jgi:hypothetical protein
VDNRAEDPRDIRGWKGDPVAFIGDVVVRVVDAVQWRLDEPLTYRGHTDTFTVPDGFVTDFASVPRLVTWLLPRYGDYTRAAILHDYLWDRGEVTTKDADGLFRRSMRELGVSIPRRWMMWAAVRTASAMRGATAKDWLAYLLVAPLSLAFVAIPALVVQAWLVLFWVVELAFWLGARATGSQEERPAYPAQS